MHRLALKTLFESFGKALGAIVGVAAAGTLIFAQLGLYQGFLQTSSAFIRRTGGDLWVMARGTQVLDNGEAIAEGPRQRLRMHGCVRAVRGVIVDYVQVRAPSGELVTAQVMGVDARPWDEAVPWSMAQGLPRDLDAPGRVAIDGMDVAKLGIEGQAIGAALDAEGQLVTVAALTQGIRPFTLMPYVFARLPLARRLGRLGDQQVSFWVADLQDPSCAPAVMAHVERDPDLQARTTGQFEEMTQWFWVHSSGIGSILSVGAILSLLVGMIVIGQTLTAITRSNLRELGTLKALGASERELAAFVGWQAGILALVGGTLALGCAFALRQGLASFGIELVMSPPLLLLGAVAVVSMCALASLGSLRTVLSLDAKEVLK